MITFGDYRIAEPDTLETPAMLIFRDVMDHNIRSVCELVGGGENLFAHVKTHKSVDVARREVELGIHGFKCATLKELEMVLEAGATRAILSYPQCQAIKIERLCDLVEAFPDAWISAIASKPFHCEVLAAVAEQREQVINVMLDIDAGMRRTGIDFGTDAEELYRDIHADPYLQASGFHVYDGHDNYSDLAEREAAARTHIDDVREFRRQIESGGVPVPLVVGGGSWSFQFYAREADMLGSPGTFIYWDAGYRSDMPELPFRWASLILTQVVDCFPESGRITTDLGVKGVSSDLKLAERAFLLGHESARLVGQSEEHGMFSVEGELPAVGDYLLAVPGHICPTTIRYPGSHVIDSAGNVVDYYIHTARDRQ